MKIKVADQAWLAAALLHREHPEKGDFSLQEIGRRAEKEFGKLRPGVLQHLISHGVAHHGPTPAAVRLFTQTERGRRRLFKPEDACHPRRTGKAHPEARQIPLKYHPLIEWYEQRYARTAGPGRQVNAGSSDPNVFMSFVGWIPAHDLALMKNVIEKDCERMDHEAQ